MKITKYLFKTCFIVSATVLFVCSFNALADFSCTSEISYKWQKNIQSEENKKEAGSVDKKENTGDEVFFGTVQVKASSEDQAKAAILEAINKAKSKSDSVCKDSHENQSKCIAIKYTTNASLLHGLTFEQRKAIQDSIKDDCVRSTGSCLGSSASEPKCSEIKKEEGKTEEKADAKSDGKKGDAKKK